MTDSGWYIRIRAGVAQLAPIQKRDLEQNEVELRVDLYAMTANTATYSRLSDCPIPYRSYFATHEVDDVPPTWGVATVVRTNNPKVTHGQRLFGYLPMATHHIMEVEAFTEHLVDTDPAHATMHRWYRTYRKLGSPHLDEARRVSIWPVFPASFTLARTVADHPESLDRVLVTSASSKTALGLALMLSSWSDIRTIGLTSAENLAHVERTGIFDDVVPYENQSSLNVKSRTGLLDLTGNPDLISEITKAHGANLRLAYLLGYTHPNSRVHLPLTRGPRPEVFFTPEREDELIAQRGKEAYAKEYSEAESRFIELSKTWFQARTRHGRGAALEYFEALMNTKPVPWVTPTIAPQDGVVGAIAEKNAYKGIG